MAGHFIVMSFKPQEIIHANEYCLKTDSDPRCRN